MVKVGGGIGQDPATEVTHFGLNQLSVLSCVGLERQEKLGILEKIQTAKRLCQSPSQIELSDSVGITKFL